ncbi:hypothetical protein cypCar_00040318 [Cyprinus carpio]|nr:hypothetical protein cypCar_00040318 [Cyprinus carpio]
MNRSLLMDRDSTSCPAQGTMFHFLSKLRRHASLEGAGSPRRRAFQRQRAASETLDHGEETLQGGVRGRSRNGAQSQHRCSERHDSNIPLSPWTSGSGGW